MSSTVETVNRNFYRSVFFRGCNLLGFVGVVIVNALANALPINGLGTGELSDMYPNLFVPAGLTFSIWGVIYLLLAAFSIHQLRRESWVRDKIGPLFLLSCAANMGWIFAWHYKMVVLSLLVMCILFASLLLIYQRLGIAAPGASSAEKLFGYIPFGVYLGWISVALIANVTAVLVDAGWSGFGISEVVWTVVVLLVGSGVGKMMVLKRNDIFFGLVMVWAYAGIVLKRLSVEPVYLSVAIVAGLCAATLLVMVVVKAPRWFRT